MSGMPSSQRTRTKTSDFSDMFRSGYASRHSPAPSASTESAIPKPRRSMLPFLGRKKPIDQSRGPAATKSSTGTSPVNTVRRSFGNGHSVLMITPSNAPSLEPPLPSTLPPLTVSPPSLGSKFAAHFTPLRSPSKNLTARHSASQNTPATSSPATLSPPANDDRTPSFESSRSSMQSRSTTPRPLRSHHTPVTGERENDDFSNLFTLPQVKKAAPLAKNSLSATTSTINTPVGPTPKRSSEDAPPSPTPPSSPCLQFPIPPSTFSRAQTATTERPHHSGDSCTQELVPASSSSHIRLPKAAYSPRVVTNAKNNQVTSDEQRPKDEHKGNRNRHSESDTDASRTSPKSSNFRPTMLPKVATLKPPASFQSQPAKNSSGPPPSAPLPSPPLSTAGSIGSTSNSSPAIPSVNSVTSSRLSGASPRPRANTLSVPSAYNTGRSPALKHNSSSAPHISLQNAKASAGLMPDASADQIREALALQRRKYTQLQEYIVTITKRYEDDRVALTRTIEKLERDIRKKTREIEGLRWLVIHNGGASDIDAAAHLARSSLSMQDDDLEAARPSPSSVKRSQTLTESLASPSEAQSVSGQNGLGINFHHDRQSSSTLEIPSDYTVSSATSSQSSLSLQAVTPPTTSLSAIPEQPFTAADISRADRQRAKEERRAARALRRISASSVSALSSGSKVTTELSTPDQPFDPKHGMDDVLEKLRPFANI